MQINSQENLNMKEYELQNHIEKVKARVEENML